MAFNRNFAFNILVTARANTKEIDTAVNSLKDFQDSVRFIEKALFRFNTLAAAGRRLLIGGAALSGGFLLTAKSAADLETQMVDVAKTTGITGSETAALRDRLRDLSQQLPVTASELSEVALAAGRMGLVADQAGQQAIGTLTKFTRIVEKAALATTLGTEEATEATGRLTRNLGLTIDQAENLLSAVNSLENQTLATAREVVDIAIRFGAFAKTINVSTEEVLGLSAAMREFGVQTQLAGTQITVILGRMQKNFREFARVAGVSSKKFADLVRNQPTEALLQFSAGLRKIAEKDTLAFDRALRKTGLSGGRVRRVISVLAANVERARDIIALSNKEFEKGTSLQEEFEKQMKTLNSRVQVLINSIRGLADRMGETLLPILKFVVDAATIFFRIVGLIPKPILFLIAVVGLLVGGLALLLGGIITIVGVMGVMMTGVLLFIESAGKFIKIVKEMAIGLQQLILNIVSLTREMPRLINQFKSGTLAAGSLSTALRSVFDKDGIEGLKTGAAASRKLMNSIIALKKIRAPNIAPFLAPVKGIRQSGIEIDVAVQALKRLRGEGGQFFFSTPKLSKQVNTLAGAFKKAGVQVGLFSPNVIAAFKAQVKAEKGVTVLGTSVSTAAKKLRLMRNPLKQIKIDTKAAGSAFKGFAAEFIRGQDRVIKSFTGIPNAATGTFTFLINGFKKLRTVIVGFVATSPLLQKSFSFLKADLAATATRIGGLAKKIPVLPGLFSKISGAASGLFAKLTPAIGGVTGALAGPLSAALGGVGSAFTAIGGPVIATVLAAVGGIAAAVFAIKDNFLGLGDTFNELISSAKELFSAFTDGLGIASKEGEGFFDIMKKVLKIVFTPFLFVLKIAFKLLSGVFKLLKPVFRILGAAFAFISFILQGIVDFVDFLTPAFEFLLKAINAILFPFRFLLDLISSALTFSLQGTVGQIAEGNITGAITGAADGAVVQPTTGGTQVRVAEAGEAEVIAPLSKLPELTGAGGAGVTNIAISLQLDGREVGRALVPIMDEEMQLARLDGRTLSRRGTGA